MRNYIDESEILWSIIIIAQYDTDDKLVVDAYKELENSIVSQGFNKSIEYLIFQYYENEEYIIVKRSEELNGNVFLKLVPDESGGIPRSIIDFYTGIELAKFITDLLPKNFAGNHKKLLITWGHGTGYGFFPSKNYFHPSDIEISESFKQMQFIRILQTASFIEAQMPVKDLIDFEKLETDYNVKQWSTDGKLKIKPPKILSLIVFKTVILKSIGKIDLMLTMTCYMQMFETGYYLRDSVEIMVSPQTGISFWGYNYMNLFEMLHKDPNTSSNKIAENLCFNFKEKYFDESLIRRIRSHPVIEPDNTFFSANRLSDYSKIQEALREVLIILLDNQGTDFPLFINKYFVNLKEIVRQGRIQAYKLHKELPIIDLNTFISNIGKLIYDYFYIKVFKESFFTLKAKTAESVMISYSPGQLFESMIGKGNLPIQGPQGISMFIPNFNSSTEVDFLRYLRANFNFGSMIDLPEWDRFLIEIIGIELLKEQ